MWVLKCSEGSKKIITVKHAYDPASLEKYHKASGQLKNKWLAAKTVNLMYT